MSFDTTPPKTSVVVWRTAKRILEVMTIKTDSRTDEIYYYEEGVYKKGAETLIKEKVQTQLHADTTTHIVNEVLNTIRRKTYIDSFTTDIELICLKNCVLNIRTLETQEHSEEFLFTNKLNIEYNAEAQAPRIKRFLREILNERNTPVIEEFAGYGLYRGYPIHKSFMFDGDGENGKTTLLNLIAIFLGVDNVSSVELDKLGSNRFASADLYQKLANICADIPSTTLTSTGQFKMLTGQDSIRAEKKYKNAFYFTNYAKLAFSTNKIPLTKDFSAAFFRRWIILRFPNKFQGENCNPNLLNELTTPEELSGFLNLALQGLKRLLENNKFSYELTTEQIKDLWLFKSDSIYTFVKCCVEENRRALKPKHLFYNAYSDFARENKLYVADVRVFWKKLRWYVAYNEDKRFYQGRRIRHIIGLKLINTENSAHTYRSISNQLFSNLTLRAPQLGNSQLDRGTHTRSEILTSSLDTLDNIEIFLDFIKNETQLGSIPVSKDLVLRKAIELYNGNEHEGNELFELFVDEDFIRISVNGLFVNYVRDYRDSEELMYGTQIEGEEEDIFDDLEEEEEEEDVIE